MFRTLHLFLFSLSLSLLPLSIGAESEQAEKAEETTANILERAHDHARKSLLLEQQKDYEKALRHERCHATLLDSFLTQSEDRQMAELKQLYDASKVAAENSELHEVIAARGTMTITVCLLLTVIVCCSYFYFQEKEKERLTQLRAKDDLLSRSRLELEQRTNQALREQQTLREQEMALRLALQRQAQLEAELKESQQPALSTSTSESEAELLALRQRQEELNERLFRTNEVVRKIEKLSELNPLQKHRTRSALLLSPTEKEALIEAINENYNGLIMRLKEACPALTTDDLFTLCLVRMQISNTDSALLLSCSDEALKKRKYRIKKDKLQMPDLNVPLLAFLEAY